MTRQDAAMAKGGEGKISAHEQSAFAAVLQSGDAGKIIIPGGDFLLNAEFEHSGPDLVLVGADGTRILVQGFFADSTPPNLVTSSGASIDAALAAKLAGPLAPGQYAQASGGAALAAIGKVGVLNGKVMVKHADGTKTELHKGDPVFKDDVLDTDKGGSVGITFADGTTFSLGGSGRMVLDELVYDPIAHTGSGNIAVLKGAFSFVSGQIPKSHPDAMTIKTPVMTVGIRGTAGAGNTQTVVLLAEPGGVAGELVVTTSSGQSLTINVPGLAANIGAGGMLFSVQMSLNQLQQFNAVISANPNASGFAPPSSNSNGNSDSGKNIFAPPPETPGQKELQKDIEKAIEKAVEQKQVETDKKEAQKDAEEAVKEVKKGIDELVTKADSTPAAETTKDESPPPQTVIDDPIDEPPLPEDNTILGANQAGGSLRFDGVNDYAQAAASTLTVGTGDFTIEATINPLRDGVILSKGQEGGASQLALTVLDGYLVFVMDDGLHDGASSVMLASNDPVYMDSWTHVAVTRTGNHFELYINGKLSGAADSDAPITMNSTEPLVVGGQLDSDGNPVADLAFEGQVDNVRLWKETRTEAEIGENYQLGTPADPDHNLVANWTMNTLESGAVPNAGNGPDLTLGDHAPVLINPPGHALHFGGGHIEMQHAVVTRTMTVEAWVKPVIMEGSYPIFYANNDCGPGRLSIGLNSSGFLTVSYTDADGVNNGPITSTVGLHSQAWNHIAVVFNTNADATSGTVDLYVDGIKAGGAIGLSVQMEGVRDSAFLGHETGNFRGEMAELRIWDQARTAADIQANMNVRLSGEEFGLIANMELGDIHTDYDTRSGMIAPNNSHGDGPAYGDGVVVSGCLGEMEAVAIKPISLTSTLITNADTPIHSTLLAVEDFGEFPTYSVAADGQPDHGWLYIQPDGTFEYRPFDDYVGTDTFTVEVRDGHDAVAFKTISVRVQAVDAPTAPEHAPNAANHDAVALYGQAAIEVTNGLVTEDSSVTYEAWMHQDTSGAAEQFILSAGSGTDTFSLSIVNGTLRATVGEHPVDATAPVDPTIWHHFAARLSTDGSTTTVTLFVDGNIAGQETFNGTYNITAPTAYLGRSLSTTPGTEGYLHGKLSDIRVYTEARDQADIRADMSGSGGTTNLVARWTGAESGTGTLVEITGNHEGAFTQTGNHGWGDRVLAVTELNEQINLSGMTIANPDGGLPPNAVVSLSLHVKYGTLHFGNLNGVTKLSGDNDTSTIVLQGTPASLTTALSNVIYSPASGFVGRDHLDVVVDEHHLTLTRKDGGSLDILVLSPSPTAFADTLIGSDGADMIDGLAGNDLIDGHGGSDILTGGAGADIFRYSANTQSTFTNTDTITDFGGSHGADVIDFAGMADMAYATTPFAFTGDLATTINSINLDTAITNQVVFFTDDTDGWLYVKGPGTGTSFDGTLIRLADTVSAPAFSTIFQEDNGVSLIGGTAGGHLTGGSGNDHLSGGGGADTLSGGTGNDVLVAGAPPPLTKLGGEFQINTNTNGNQFTPSAAGLADGGYVVVWEDNSQTLGDSQQNAIHGQRYNADGTTHGGEFLVNTITEREQWQPKVTALTDGGFAVVWREDLSSGSDTSGSSVYAQIFDADGSKRLSSESLVNTTTGGNQHVPNILALPGGGFVASWADDSSGTNNVMAQAFNSAGGKVGSQFMINSEMGGHQGPAVMTMLTDGSIVMVWDDSSVAFGDADRAIHAQRFNADLTKLGGEFLVNTTTGGSQSESTVKALEGGGFVVAWRDDSLSGGDTNASAVRAQCFAADGSQLGNEFLVNTNTTGNQFQPSIIALRGGGFVIAWSDDQEGGANNINAQQYAADGTKIGGETCLNTTTNGDQTHIALTELADGRIVATWSDNSQTGTDNSGYSIRGQILSGVANVVLDGGSGNDILTGGEGNDTAIFTGNADQYTISTDGSHVQVTDTVAGRDGTDDLTSVETLHFQDRTFDHLVLGSAGADQFIADIAPPASALSLDGSDDYVAVSMAPTAVNSFTFETWIKLDTAPYLASLLSSTNWGTGAVHLIIQDDVFKLAAYPTGVQFNYSVSNHMVDTLRHVAIAYDDVAHSAMLYIDGQLVDTQSYDTVTPIDFGQFTIGAWDNGTYVERFIDGSMADVRLWTTARTQDEILGSMTKNLTGAESGLLGNWQLDEDTNETSTGAPNGTFFGGTPNYAALAQTAVTSADTLIVGGAGNDSLSTSNSASLTDADFANLHSIENLVLSSTASATQKVELGAISQKAGLTTVNASNSVAAVTLDASGRTAAITLTGGTGADTLSGGAGDDLFRYTAETQSTLSVTDTITNFGGIHGADRIRFAGIAGIGYDATPYTFTTDVSTTVAAIVANGGIDDQLVFFTNATDGWLYVKGDGQGTSYDGTLIKLAGHSTVPNYQEVLGLFNNTTVDPSGTGETTLHIADNLVLGSNSHINLDVAGSGLTSDHVDVDGALTLGGSLTIRPQGEMTEGDTYTPLTYGSLYSTFENIYGLDDPLGLAVLDPVFGPNSLSLTLHEVTQIATAGADTLTGSDGADYITACTGNDTIHAGSGADVIAGQAGNDRIGISGTSAHLLDGGTGTDVLAWEGANGSTLDLTQMSGIVQGFEAVDLSVSGTQTLIIDAQHLLAMTEPANAMTATNNTLVVMGAGDTVQLNGSTWAAGTTASIDGHSYTVYTDSSTNAQVYVDNTVSVTHT